MNMTSLINILGWVLFFLALVANFYEYSKKNDPVVADKMKHVGTFAEWAVSLQDTLDKTNHDKLQDATEAVLKQADQSGIQLTNDMARGAVEQAVAARKKPTKKPVSEVYEDGSIVLRQPAKVENMTSGEVPAVTIEKPSSGPTDLLDSLEVK